MDIRHKTLLAGLMVLVIAGFNGRLDACSVVLDIGSEYVALNDDDDNDKDGADMGEGDTVNVSGENDLVPITLSRTGSDQGTITLSATSGGNKIKIWKHPTRCDDEAADNPDLVTLGGDNATWDAGEIPVSPNSKTLYVEGIAASGSAEDVELKLEWIGSGATPNPTSTVKITVVKVDLDIYHGQDGSIVPEGKEEKDANGAGAVTVANLNDTDGDGRTDNDITDTKVKVADPTTLTAAAAKDATTITVASVTGYAAGDQIGISKSDDSSGELRTIQNINAGTKVITLTQGLGQAYAVNDKVYHPGRDERDLMKLELRKPAPNLGGNVTLKVVSGNVKIWENSTKETEVELTAGEKQYAIGDLPATKTVYVEARAVSTAVRDIVIEWKYKDCKDTVKATAVWVNKTTRPAGEGNNPWYTRQAADGWAHNPEVGEGAGAELTDLDYAALVTHINTTRKAADGSRYGHGSHTAVGGADTRLGGRILWEFRLAPSGAEHFANLKLDITRQGLMRIWDCNIGSADFNKVSDFCRDWPWIDVELPNDDPGALATEDVDPKNRLIYSYDAPYLNHTLAATKAFSVIRFSFKEWVRIDLDGTRTTGNNVGGSRASNKFDWHVLNYAKRKSSSEMEADNASPSACAAKLTSATTGALVITVNAANAKTEGWTVTYDQANDRWNVVGTDGSSGTLTWNAGAGNWQGTGAKAGDTRVTLTATVANKNNLANGDKFDFSTFKSSIKGNEIGKDPCDVPENP